MAWARSGVPGLPRGPLGPTTMVSAPITKLPAGWPAATATAF